MNFELKDWPLDSCPSRPWVQVDRSAWCPSLPAREHCAPRSAGIPRSGGAPLPRHPLARRDVAARSGCVIMPKDLGGRNHVDRRSLSRPCRPLAMELLAGVADRIVRASGGAAKWANHPSHGVHAFHADIWRRPLRRAHRPLGGAGGDRAAARDGPAPDPQRPRRRRARGPAHGPGPDHRPRRPRRDLRRARRQPGAHRRQPGRRDLRLLRDRHRLRAAVSPDGRRASRILPPPGRRGPRYARCSISAS